MMGMARTCEKTKNFLATVETVNEVIVMYPDFTAADNEKCRLLLMVIYQKIFFFQLFKVGDWE